MNKLKDTLLKVSNLAVSFDTVDGPIDAVQGINFELKISLEIKFNVRL